jgi:ATP synthase protein I
MVEPERELVRRAVPFVPVALLVAYSLGALAHGSGAGWSAALGVAVVTANFVASALSIAWAAGISPTLVFAVALGGFFMRMVVIVIVLVGLNTLSWFSPAAFALSVVPATIVLLVFEARVLSGRMQAELWSFGEGRR